MYSMNLSARLKGYLFALLATIALSNVYIFSKAALNEIHIIQFGLYWFGLAIIWNTIYSFTSGRYRKIRKIKASHLKTLVGIGLVEVVATVSFFIAIDIIPNPSTPSFLRNIEPIFIVIIGILFLKERFEKIEKAGIVLTIIGAIVLSYNKSGSINDLFINGVQYILIATSFYAVRTIWVKLIISKIDPIIINFNKLLFLLITFFIAFILTDKSLIIPKSAFFNILIGSLIGPFFTSYAQYISLQYIEASRQTLIQSTAGVFTLLFAFIYFGSLPFYYQIIGGIITIIGISLITLGKRFIR